MANNRKNHNIPSEEENPLFHDTWKLLKNYRDAVWNLELAVQQVRNSFEIEFGSSIEEFLDSIYLAGADIGGTKLENYAKSIERSNKMLNLLNSAVDILRSKHKHGEQYYWILYYSYLSPQQLQNTDEIIEKLEPHITNISKRTYYRRRPEAVQALSSILWGYTSKDFLNTLDNFYQINSFIKMVFIFHIEQVPNFGLIAPLEIRHLTCRYIFLSLHDIKYS